MKNKWMKVERNKIFNKMCIYEYKNMNIEYKSKQSE